MGLGRLKLLILSSWLLESLMKEALLLIELVVNLLIIEVDILLLYYLWILAILAILAALYLVTSFRSLVIKFACILVIVGSIHYLVSKLEKRAV